MNFTTWYFPLFFLTVWSVYWLLGRNMRQQNVWLTCASYVFYGAWDWRFLFLLWISTIVDFFVAGRIERSDSPSHRRNWLLVSIGSNLGILGMFKYFNFFVTSAAALAESVGIPWNPVLWDIVLPVGISFYTFQTLSYTIDIYRGSIAPCKRLKDFALYVAFFPQLVAGPIERGTR
ncbi:MAG: MBOAT family protein, partial [Fuerstiella sp.]|nr:MBOAT family protein [Fuerstiella sp.]